MCVLRCVGDFVLRIPETPFAMAAMESNTTDALDTIPRTSVASEPGTVTETVIDEIKKKGKEKKNVWRRRLPRYISYIIFF